MLSGFVKTQERQAHQRNNRKFSPWLANGSISGGEMSRFVRQWATQSLNQCQTTWPAKMTTNDLEYVDQTWRGHINYIHIVFGAWH